MFAITVAMNDSHNQRATDLDLQAANVLPVCVNGLVYARQGVNSWG
jgi:hypothetical protein